jgi:hypothetical protein
MLKGGNGVDNQLTQPVRRESGTDLMSIGIIPEMRTRNGGDRQVANFHIGEAAHKTVNGWLIAAILFPFAMMSGTFCVLATVWLLHHWVLFARP